MYLSRFSYGVFSACLFGLHLARCLGCFCCDTCVCSSPLVQRSDGTREPMADFLYSYLKRRFALEQMVVEWGYNLHDACQRYSHDENIGLFWRVLNGDVSGH